MKGQCVHCTRAAYEEVFGGSKGKKGQCVKGQCVKGHCVKDQCVKGQCVKDRCVKA